MADIGANSIISIPHLKIFLDIVRDRLGALPVQQVLIYMIDLVDVSALPWVGCSI